MDLNALISIFTSMLDSLKLLLNGGEVIDIILASLKKYFGKAEDAKNA